LSSYFRGLEHIKITRRSLRLNLLPFVTLVLLLVVFASINPSFLSVDNFFTILSQSGILLLLAVGGTFVILMGSIDLSVAGVMFLACIASSYYANQMGAIALFVGLGVGLPFGIINGLLLTKLKIPSFLATLGTWSVCSGLIRIIGGGFFVDVTNQSFRNISSGFILGSIRVENVFFWSIIIWILAVTVAFRSFVLCAILAALAGVLHAGRIGGAPQAINTAFLLDSITAICIGGTALNGGVGGPHRTLIGVAILSVLSNGMNVSMIDPFTQMWIKGIVVIIAVAFSIDRSKISFIK